MAEAVQQSIGRRPPQFSLKRLFALTTLVAAVFGAAQCFGLAPTLAALVVGLAAAGGYASPGRDSAKWPAAVAAGMMGAVSVSMILPAFQRSSCTATRRSDCAYNLRQIGLGLQNYADIYGCFPPAYIADESGRPVHSWRVLILPFIEQGGLYEQYDFNEPWDGPHNSLLAAQMPPCYRCPSDGMLSRVTSSYLAITGAETAWPGADRITFSDFKDGTSNTIAVVEVASSGIHWMEPDDLPFRALSKGVNPSVGLGVSSRHIDGANCVFFDGHSNYLQNAELPVILEALATRAGGETIVGGY